MSLENQLKTLAAWARSEAPPRVDVTGRVIAVLTAGREQHGLERPLMWLAAVSSAVAVPAAVVALISYYAFADPLMEISEAIAWVVQ